MADLVSMSAIWLLKKVLNLNGHSSGNYFFCPEIEKYQHITGLYIQKAILAHVDT